MHALGPLESRMDVAVCGLAAASDELLRAIVPYDRDRLWKRSGATSMTAWLAARYRVTKATAREWVRVARALEDLPRIAREHAKGTLSWEQVRFLTRFATVEDEDHWVKVAPSMSPSALLYEAERRERVTARGAGQAHRRRSARTWWDPETSELNLFARFGPDQGALVERGLAKLADQMPKDELAERPGEARAADAIASAVTGGGGGRAPVALVVHADAATLEGTEGRAALCETEDGRQLASEVVRRLACDASVDLVLESDGRAVGIGRRGRVPSPWLRRLVVHRDRGRCRFPGCEGDRWVDAHHIVHWGNGGPTDLDNLVLLCDAHHRLIHEGGWKISGHPAWVLRFHDPTGRVLLPPDLQPELAAAGFG